MWPLRRAAVMSRSVERRTKTWAQCGCEGNGEGVAGKGRGRDEAPPVVGTGNLREQRGKGDNGHVGHICSIWRRLLGCGEMNETSLDA